MESDMLDYVLVENSKTKSYYKKGTCLLHRLDGPACEYANGDKRWYIDGKLYYHIMFDPKKPKEGIKEIRAIDPLKINIILHPKSKGSAREWGVENFLALANQLPNHTYKLFVSGTAEDASHLTELINHPNITSIAGKLSLKEFIAFIARGHVLIAASTGPLHIAAALNIKAIGLFAPMRPIFPTRWKPLGAKVEVLVEQKICRDCRNNLDCACIRNIKVVEVIKAIQHED
jgi:ADP-heptose:LPS heptosyltransferase